MRKRNSVERNQVEVIARLLQPMTALEFYQASFPGVLTIHSSPDEFAESATKEAAAVASDLGLVTDETGRQPWLVWALASAKDSYPAETLW